jgi:organic radical activating enzyme
VDSAYAKSWIKVDESSSLIKQLSEEFSHIGYKPNMVITGGEPLMYHADQTFYEVVSWLIEEGIQITFETNGTVEIDFDHYPAYRACIFALSLKLANSGEPASKRIVPQALKNLQSHSKETFLKFTIDKTLVDTSAFDEISKVRELLPELEVFCMPVGESRDTIWKNDTAVFEFCMKHNFRYSDRLHIRVFDTTQGV